MVGADRLDLTTVGRHESVSLRLPLPGGKADSWLTLLVISTAGTIYINFLGRWSRVPGGRALSIDYKRKLRQLLDTEKVVFSPTAFRRAIPLSSLEERVDDLLTLLSKTSLALAKRRRRLPARPSSIPAGADTAALEGMLTETRQTRRGRSRRLRNEALRRARGTCAVCRNDFRALLDGDGQRVLQVHHRQQLAVLDTPRINDVEDLAVLCANCHLLIHTDPRNALSVTALRKMLEDDGRYPLAPGFRRLGSAQVSGRRG
jgi:5-methylcytosine-specific restriction endonuclease McrA